MSADDMRRLFEASSFGTPEGIPMSTADDIRVWLDRHEESSYMGGGSIVCDDPDGGLLRYGRALRAVLDLHQPDDDGLCGTCDLDGQKLKGNLACATVEAIRTALGVPDA